VNLAVELLKESLRKAVRWLQQVLHLFGIWLQGS